MKSKNRNRSAGLVAVSNSSGSGSTRYMPASSFGATIQSGPKLTFTAGRRAGCMRMRYQFRLCQIYLASNLSPAPYTGKVVFRVNNTGVPTNCFEIPVGPANSFYFPSYVKQLMVLFNEFIVHGMKLHFEPRVPSTSSSTLSYTWAFAEDVDWPETHGLTTAGGLALPTELALTSLSTACTNNGWAPCDISYRASDTKMRYVAGSQLTQLSFLGANAALDRQNYPGIFLIASDTVSTATTDQLIGDVYCALDMELCDFSTPITQAASLSTSLREQDEKGFDHFRSTHTKEEVRKDVRRVLVEPTTNSFLSR